MLNTNFNPGAAVGSGAGAAEAVTGRAPSGDTADMFTKLLVAQIRNQDPLSPSDPSQFVNQLSQLSQTEAMQSLAKLNSSSASVLQSLQVLALGAQVGSEVSVATDQVRLDGKPVSGSIALGSASAATTLVLTGAGGSAHKIELGARAAGAAGFTLDPVALGLAPGSYTLSVQTSSGAAAPVEIAGRLDSVRLAANGAIVLKVAGVGDVAPAQVIGFNGSAGTVAALSPAA